MCVPKVDDILKRVSSGLLKQDRLSTSCDSKASHKIIDNGKDGCLPSKWSPDGLDQSVNGDANDESYIQPVNMLIPVGTGDGRLGDVGF